MDRLREQTLTRLRDKLRDRGQRPSVTPPGNLPLAALELLQVSMEYGPLCEAMYLMMAADERVLNVERDVLKGAMRTLTDDSVRGVHIEALLDNAAKRLAAEGRDTRLKVVIDALREDPVTAEVAYVLASAIAMADDNLDERERVMLEQLSHGLGLDEHRISVLDAELELELNGKD